MVVEFNHHDTHPINQDPATLPLLYHLHHQQYAEDLPFWLKLAKQQGSPVLELGCGTRRVLQPLAEAGYKCFGIDNDLKMLDFFQNQMSDIDAGGIHLINADFLSFSFCIKYPLIIMPCNTFSTLQTGLRKTLLGHVYRHLADDGIFSISMPNPEILSSQTSEPHAEIETTFQNPGTGHPVQVSYRILRTGSQIAFNWYYDHLLPNGKIHRSEVSTTHFLASAEEYRNQIKSSGLEIEKMYGDFSGTPYSQTSPNLIIAARKI